VNRKLLHSAIGFVLTLASFGQNVLMNNWTIHHNTDTNIFITVTAMDQLRHSNTSVGKWYDGNVNNLKSIAAADVRNRELIRFSYSQPSSEISYVARLQSEHTLGMNGREFNGLMRGEYDNDSIFIRDLNSVHGSVITHSIEWTKKLGKTDLQLSFNGTQVNSLRTVQANGILMKNESMFRGDYTMESFFFNNELDYLGDSRDLLHSRLNWGDSLRQSTLVQLPLLPSMGFHIVHRPTEFTEFQLRLDGIAPESAITLKYAFDSTSYSMDAIGIPTYELFTEELPLNLNSNYTTLDSNLILKDTVVAFRSTPFRAQFAYKVQFEPLLTFGLSASYEKYRSLEYITFNALIERKYTNDVSLQVGISNYIYGITIQPNILVGVNAKVSDKLRFMAFSDAMLSYPHYQNTLVPRWSNRFSLNAVLQYQLL